MCSLISFENYGEEVIRVGVWWSRSSTAFRTDLAVGLQPISCGLREELFVFGFGGGEVHLYKPGI